MRPVLAFDGDHATLWRPAHGSDGRIGWSRSRAIPLDGDAGAVAADGPRARSRALAAAALRRAKVAIALAAARRAAQDARAARGGRGEPAAGARLRSRPPHAVQARRAVLRRRGRRSRRRAQHDHASTSPPRAARVVDPALAHAAAWGAQVVAVVPRAAGRRAPRRGSTCCRREARTSRALVARWQFWLPLALLAAIALAAVVHAAVAEARVRDRAERSSPTQARAAGRGLGALRARARARRSATTTSRSSASTRIPARVHVLDDGDASCCPTTRGSRSSR